MVLKDLKGGGMLCSIQYLCILTVSQEIGSERDEDNGTSNLEDEVEADRDYLLLRWSEMTLIGET